MCLKIYFSFLSETLTLTGSRDKMLPQGGSEVPDLAFTMLKRKNLNLYDAVATTEAKELAY